MKLRHRHYRPRPAPAAVPELIRWTHEVTALLLTLAALSVCAASGAATDELTRTGVYPLERLGQAGSSEFAPKLSIDDHLVPVLVIEPLRSAAVDRLLSDFTVYRLIASTDWIHGADYSALLIGPTGIAHHLRNDEEVARYCHRYGLCRRVQTTEDAMRLVRLFADLRSYHILERIPEFPDVRPPSLQAAAQATDYRFLAEERSDCWAVHVTFFVSDYSQSCVRYYLRIWKPPGGGIDIAKPVLIRMGRLVF